MADGHELALALRAAYLALHRRTDAAVARHGVTADQFVLLDALAGGDALTQREVARRTGSDPNTVRAMLVLLERRGLVARPPHPTDARARTVALTPAGRKAFAAVWSATGRVRAGLRAAAGADADAVLGALRRLADGLGVDSSSHDQKGGTA
jgi:DNA-binding MarR family transcriptional regulator